MAGYVGIEVVEGMLVGIEGVESIVTRDRYYRRDRSIGPPEEMIALRLLPASKTKNSFGGLIREREIFPPLV